MIVFAKPIGTQEIQAVAHNSTIFGQLLKLVPRHEFEKLAKGRKTGRMPRKLTRWSQFMAMGMAQLAGRCSLRDMWRWTTRAICRRS